MSRIIHSYKGYGILGFVFILSLNMIKGQDWRAGIHDPSSIVKCKDTYWVFGTGDGIYCRYSKDLITWSEGPTPFSVSKYESNGEVIVTSSTCPTWINNYVHGAKDTDGNPVFHGGFWAPDIIYMNNQYYLYYSCSEWGTMTSTIGCVTNKTLDPNDPDYEWIDVGFLGIWSYRSGYALNAIDPSICRGHDGKVWMTYGSFNEMGIVVTELDTITGIPKTYSGNLPGKSIANSWTGPNSNDYGEGEGSCMVYYNGYYYLFYNKGGCCNGVNSTYYIVVGRSTSPTGMFIDKSYKAMRTIGIKSGGTVLFKHDDSRGTDDRYFGPGHVGIFRENGIDYVTFHYYDPNWPWSSSLAGGPTLGLAKLEWGENGWPTISMDFLDEGYYTLKNVNSNKYMDLQLHQASNGKLLYQYNYSDTYDTQKWLFTPLGTGEYTIRNYADTLQYVEATGTNNEDYLRVTSSYTGAVNQKFRLVQSPNGKVIIYPSKSDKLIEIPNAYTQDYQIKLWYNTNHNCQRWIPTVFEPPLSTYDDISLSDIDVYPNPTDGIVHIKCDSQGKLVIYNSNGNEILTIELTDSNTEIDISGLTSGLYLFKISGGERTMIKKVMKK